MFEDWKVAVVIPARNEQEHLPKVLSMMPELVDEVVVIDDGSTDRTGALVANADLIRLEGEGVGAAIDAGHKHLLAKIEGRFISVVMAGDGQMDPSDLTSLLQPIIDSKAHHVKGERLDRAGKMPKIRRFGTLLLSFLTTLACGQTIRDSQCGYTATSSEVLSQWDWSRSWKGYGYPNWWLMRLSTEGWSIAHVPVKSVYEGQTSGIKIPSFFAEVSLMLLIGLHYRVFKSVLPIISVHPIPIALVICYSLGWLGLVYSLTYGVIFFPIPILMWWITHKLDRVIVEVLRRPLE
ncbi:MAG TPA: glycosyltransferase family 2 protein [Candidatus Poseidoniales archaeon]|nr:MAG: hypothetical protein CXT71_04815 [Euryarchaeota archaeon]HIF45363.1 glycosyltransferase family 2 protein [Candidatus Poseidoniales archaeon]